VPAPLREMLTGFEAGAPMLQVKTGSWQDLGADAGRIRTAVFVQEQRIPAELEWDEDDAGAVHAVAYNRLGQPVATGRLLAGEGGQAKIGRMAVHQALRGCGFGEQVLRALAEVAQQRGDCGITLHAQRTARSFYARLGFEAQGEPFEEAGIAHLTMTSALPLAA
jgi:predicted GNAT family N-acyltransferase